MLNSGCRDPSKTTKFSSSVVKFFQVDYNISMTSIIIDPKTPRDIVISHMLGRIDSLDELNKVSKEVHEWLIEHPDDREARGNCESLAMLRGCFK